jgi:hypothetical protein
VNINRIIFLGRDLLCCMLVVSVYIGTTLFAYVLYKYIRGLQKSSSKLITKLQGREGVTPAWHHSRLASLPLGIP